MLFAFIWGAVWAFAKPLIVVILTALAGQFTYTARDRQRTEIYNTITDDLLYAMLFERPTWDWLKDAAAIKDALVKAILENSKLTNNPAIAERLAKAAIARAASSGTVKAGPSR